MRIAQRGTSITLPTGSQIITYLIDRFQVIAQITTGTIVYSQNTLIATDTPYQYGFKNSKKLLVTAAVTNVPVIQPGQVIEANNIADLMWGNPFGQPLTVSFWSRVGAPNNSIVSITLRNGYNLSGSTPTMYNTSYTVRSSNVWQYVSATIPPPPTGTTWNTDNAAGLELFIGSYSTTASVTGTANTWITTNNYGGVTGVTNIYGTTGNFLEFTGVQVEKGPIATPFEFRPYGLELMLCQRYYEVINIATGPGSWFWQGYGNNATCNLNYVLPLKVTKRLPTITGTTANSVGITTGNIINVTVNGGSTSCNITCTDSVVTFNTTGSGLGTYPVTGMYSLVLGTTTTNTTGSVYVNSDFYTTG
jgi:hypothetical protein